MLQPLTLVPGIDKSDSPYADSQAFSFSSGASNATRVGRGRYTDGQWVRFLAGFPEKIGGWAILLAAGSITGTPRVHIAWRDNDGNPRYAIGTDNHLYTWDGTTLTDITPLRTIDAGTLSSPISTTNNSKTVTIADSSAQLKNGDWVYLSAASSVGGILVNGWYQVSGFSAGTGYNITAATAATSTAGPGGGTTVFDYPRVTLTNPFITTNGSATVKVVHTAHGAATGDFVDFSGASAIEGITLNGEYQLTVVDANDYTVVSTSTATGNGTGGGSVSVTYDITMTAASVQSPVTYGEGAYGLGAYGYSATATQLTASGWTLARYGYLLLGAPIGGTIYVWDPSQGGRAYPLLNAPANCQAMFVTNERFVVALQTATAASGGNLVIAWADQNDFTDWTSSPTNTAETGRTLIGGNYFTTGLPVRDGVALIFTDRCCFQMTYSGDSFVYDMPLAGDNCGCVGPHAAAAQGEVAYWMGDKEFWTWTGSVSPLPTDDIRSYVFGALNTLNISKVAAGTLRQNKEIWFLFAAGSGTENNTRATYHIDQGCWSVDPIGTFGRASWCDADLFSYASSLDTAGNLYQQEVGVDGAGSAIESYVTVSPIDIQGGMLNCDFFGLIPDFERITNNATLTALTAYYPMDGFTANPPITITPPDNNPRIDLRADGKMIGFTLTSNTLGGDFRLGLVRVDFQPSGARR